MSIRNRFKWFIFLFDVLSIIDVNKFIKLNLNVEVQEGKNSRQGKFWLCGFGGIKEEQKAIHNEDHRYFQDGR